MGAEGAKPQINLPPGFRFYPTDEELVVHYLCRKAASQPLPVPVIAEIDLYKFNPWDLPEKALFGERERYFFSPRERKYPNGSRPNRAAASGYWKATGTDKSITTVGGGKVGVKKTLVFYQGRPTKGVKTNWIMQEYCLADSASRAAKRAGSLRLDGWVLCRVYKKLYGAQRGAVARKRNAEPTWQEGELASSSPEIDGTQAPINLSRISKLNRISSFKSAMRYDHKPCQNGAADKSSGALRVVNIGQPAWTKFVGRGPNLAENGATDANPAIVAEAGSAGMRPKEEPLEMDCSLWEKPRISTESTAEEIRQISDAPLQRLPSLQMLFGLDLIDGLFPPLEPIPPLGDEDAFFATF